MSYADYIDDESQHGQYQYVTIQQIINDYLAVRDQDDYTFHVPRYKILYQAQRGLRELYYDVLQEIKAIELELGPSLSIILPPDYVNYVRISWVDDKGRLHPMAEDKTSNIARGYLQDHDYNLLFDNNGCVLEDDGTMDQVPGSAIQQSNQNIIEDYRRFAFCFDSFTPNRNLSNVYKNGKYRIDKTNGVIYFGSDAFSKNIVLEYISDGLYVDACEGTEEGIRVHKFAEQALIDFIYYGSIKQRRNVPMNEKIRARKEYYNSRRISKRRINALRRSEILQAFRGDSVWIKTPGE